MNNNDHELIVLRERVELLEQTLTELREDEIYDLGMDAVERINEVLPPLYKEDDDGDD